MIARRRVPLLRLAFLLLFAAGFCLAQTAKSPLLVLLGGDTKNWQSMVSGARLAVSGTLE